LVTFNQAIEGVIKNNLNARQNPKASLTPRAKQKFRIPTFKTKPLKLALSGRCENTWLKTLVLTQ
jgi:hypothetical protein